MYQPELETLPRKALLNIQLERLQATLRRIQSNNPEYRTHLRGMGANEVNKLDDFRHFPFMDKATLREAYPFGFTCAPQTDFMRMHMSSGTTGTPVICPHTPHDVQQWGEIMARCLSSAGIGRDDVLQITPSFGLFNGGFGFHYGATALETMIIPIGPGRTKLQLKFMQDIGTTAIVGIATYPLRLIEVAQKEGFDFRRDTQLRVGVFGSEIWSDELRKRIENIMGIESFDIIGMTESGGVGMGIDCVHHNGIHVWEDHYLVEFIDPESREPVADGEWGEMVFTTLTREALPLIRFRTRDISRVISRETCACGRTSLRMDRIAGRTDDMLIVKGTNFFPRQIENLVLHHPDVGNDYLIEIDRKQGADHLTLKIETENSGNTSLAQQIDGELYDLLGLHAEIDLLSIGTLPRPPGKAVRVKDMR
ncbi:MAG: phenylacetate--CoA ligase [Chloroflexi bacterium]|nr:phenylacetate--CoA ligase [Chloroflexota bacterium]